MVESAQHTSSKQKASAKKEPACFVGLIRHGERADYVPKSCTSKKYTVHHDPPLSDIGIQQALETGKALKKFLIEEQGYETIVIECSPFIRTMMTAANIVKGMGTGQVQINYLFTELLAPHLFDDCPMGDILLKKLDGVDFEHGDFFKPQAERMYPESRTKGKERVQTMIQHFKEKYKNCDQKVAHLAVTHGFFVNQFSKQLNGQNPYADFCSISAMEIRGSKGTLVLDSDSNHVLSWS
ncbi:hypothetical protein FGO68_gene10477 [Halteria grandinella]|uniref:Histidine phosphatase family protein n=1 Tax=Halteria grandinella TaxID=5974 RepID=A0A8J8NIZ7_HALGN|nr:hypothetical protein FGO68_gene10477 [Halteria grandinella]